MVESNMKNSESDRKEYYANVAKAYHKLDQIVSKFEKWDFFKLQGRSVKDYKNEVFISLSNEVQGIHS
jgi:predicted flavoprotein YhiN